MRKEDGERLGGGPGGGGESHEMSFLYLPFLPQKFGTDCCPGQGFNDSHTDGGPRKAASGRNRLKFSTVDSPV